MGVITLGHFFLSNKLYSNRFKSPLQKIKILDSLLYDTHCITLSTKKIVLDSGEIRNLVWENKKAMSACDPYEEWYKIKRWCDLEKVTNIEWTYDHSLNGAPYRRIVDVKNACELTYHPFSHNEWIREDGATIDKKVIKNSF